MSAGDLQNDVRLIFPKEEITGKLLCSLITGACVGGAEQLIESKIGHWMLGGTANIEVVDSRTFYIIIPSGKYFHVRIEEGA
jgi:hypothetical protein